MRTIVLTAVAIAALLAVIGCQSSDDDSNDKGLKNSTWLGTLNDEVDGPVKLEVTFDADGNIEAVVIEGVDQGLTGAVSDEGNDVYGIELDDGTVGAFVQSEDAAGIALDDGSIGAVERDADDLAGSYAQADSEGDWVGTTYLFDASFSLTDSWGLELTAAADGTYTGSRDDGLTFDGDTFIQDTNYGVFSGAYNGSDGFTGTQISIYAPSRGFSMTRVCPASFTFPQDCGMGHQTKQ